MNWSVLLLYWDSQMNWEMEKLCWQIDEEAERRWQAQVQ